LRSLIETAAVEALLVADLDDVSSKVGITVEVRVWFHVTRMLELHP